MCFSATASLMAGASLSLGDIATLKQTKTKSEKVFASIPLFFGIQQLIEGIVWLSLYWHVNTLNIVASHVYFLFSDVWWPVFVPLSVLFLETIRWRRRLLSFFEILGLLTASYFLYFFFTSSITAHIAGHCLTYSHPKTYLPIALGLYVIAACGSFFVSSKKFINVFGFFATLFLLLAATFYRQAFVSVWCFFAAILSTMIFVYFFSKRKKSLS